MGGALLRLQRNRLTKISASNKTPRVAGLSFLVATDQGAG